MSEQILIDKSLLARVIERIEEDAVQIEYEWGACRSLNEMYKTDDIALRIVKEIREAMERQ